MQYEAATPAEYMNMLEDDWRREKVEGLRTLIKTTAPDLVEGINYKMLSYSDDEGTAFHLNAQKQYVSLYVGDASKVDPEGDLLKRLNVGKGCIRFKKSSSVEESRINEFIARTVDLRLRGEDIDC